MKRKMAAAAVLALAMAGSALALPPVFKNGEQVAAAMERHYNGADYKKRIAKAGAKVRGRILCADDGFGTVECTGRLTVKGVPVTAEWSLAKRTAQRAKLSWFFEGKGVFEADSEVVAPSAFRLARF